MAMRTTVCTIIALAGLAHIAGAQILTPPPAKVRGLEELVPPAPPPPPAQPTAAPAKRTNVNEGDVPENVKKAFENASKNRKAKPAELPDLKYQSLVKKDASGNPIHLDEPVDLAALRVNPMLDKGFVDNLGSYLKDRQEIIDRLLVDQLDVLEDVESGLITKSDLTTREGLAKVVSRTRPLNPPAAPPAITEDLKAKGSLTDEQARFNKKIISEYTYAFLPHGPKDIPQAERQARASEVLSVVLRQNVDEYMLAYQHAKPFIASHLAELADSVKADAGVKDQLKALGKSVTPAMSNEQKVGVYEQAAKLLSIDQRRDLMRAALALRSKQ